MSVEFVRASCDSLARWPWLPVGKVSILLNLILQLMSQTTTMVKWCLSLLGTPSLLFTEGFIYKLCCFKCSQMELCSLYSPARLSHSNLVTICAVARLAWWLGRKVCLLPGWCQQTPSLLVGAAHVGNFTTLCILLVDTEIWHSCPKAQGCF